MNKNTRNTKTSHSKSKPGPSHSGPANESEKVNNELCGSLITLNIRGLIIHKDRSKLDQIKYLASDNNAYFVVITESWLQSEHLDAEIHINRYTSYRADRDGRSRGGVLIYVKSGVAVKPVIQTSNGVVEAVILKIPTCF